MATRYTFGGDPIDDDTVGWGAVGANPMRISNLFWDNTPAAPVVAAPSQPAPSGPPSKANPGAFQQYEYLLGRPATAAEISAYDEALTKNPTNYADILDKAQSTNRSEVRGRLADQILAQGTSSRWSGQGFGSAEANARDMAKILAGIGITDIKQFGEIDVPADVAVQPVYDYQMQYVGGEEGWARVPSVVGYTGPDGNPVDSSLVTQGITSTGEGDSSGYVVSYYAPGGTQKAYGNKVTGQAVPNTYGERQTGNAFGGTYAGEGNTGYRVQFAPDGTPVFYTTGASSNDSFLSDIAPFVGLGLMFIPGLQGLGASIGTALGASAAAAPVIGNAIIQGALAEASGGDFLKGAALGAAGSFVPGINSEISGALGGGTAANIAAGSLTGGALSSLAGGDFERGALIGGAGAGIGEIRNDLRQEMFDTSMTESGLAGQTATSPSDVFLEQPNYENISIADIVNNLQPFQPDYSLSSPEYAPGLKSAPIDTSNYEIGSYDYSLGNMANANLVDGSGLTVDLNASIGDPNSFINQPPPQINYTLPEFTDLPPVDNSGKLAALGVAQTFLPAVITAIAAHSSAPKEAARPTGFDIVPIPGDWRSPEYNQQFTPSAPIDFGTLELLRGTQFERPLVQPTQMNYGLSGNQVSIADIIAGIQGQYGQETTS